MVAHILMPVYLKSKVPKPTDFGQFYQLSIQFASDMPTLVPCLFWDSPSDFRSAQPKTPILPAPGLRARVSTKLQEMGTSLEEHKKDLLSRVSEELCLATRGLAGLG